MKSHTTKQLEERAAKARAEAHRLDEQARASAREDATKEAVATASTVNATVNGWLAKKIAGSLTHHGMSTAEAAEVCGIPAQQLFLDIRSPNGVPMKSLYRCLLSLGTLTVREECDQAGRLRLVIDYREKQL